MGKINLDAASVRIGSGYPAPFDEPCKDRKRMRLGDVAGLTQFGVNLLRLPPGAWSSQRHWHSAEDEFVWVLEGEVVLITDEGETVLRAGDCAGFPAGVANGHHLQNRSAREAVLLEVGSRRPDEDACDYPDLDMVIEPGVGFRHRDGRPYPKGK
ncbi:MAG TPA: cupin domain-containing protein [Steroidobacteraceae bacterium]|nr:cupin domain-containing protein [Steroidobacteraceae bacterium]